MPLSFGAPVKIADNQTWGAPVGFPVFKIGSKLYTIGQDNTTTHPTVYSSADGGATWVPGSTYAWNTNACIYFTDGVDLIYTVQSSEWNSGGATKNIEILVYRISTDTWSTISSIVSLVGGGLDSAMIFADGSIGIFYKTLILAPFQIWYVVYNGGWGTPVNLTANLFPAPDSNAVILPAFTHALLGSNNIGIGTFIPHDYGSISLDTSYIFGLALDEGGGLISIANGLEILAAADFVPLNAVVMGSTLYVAVLRQSVSNEVEIFSYDGTWHSLGPFVTGVILAPLTTDGTTLFFSFIDGTGNLVIMSSTDGVTWLSQTVPVSLTTLYAAFYLPGQGMFLIASASAISLYFLPLGSTPPPPPPANALKIMSLPGYYVLPNPATICGPRRRHREFQRKKC